MSSIKVEELSVWELYFTKKGRLSRSDFGKYYVLPTILIAILLVIFLIPGSHKGDDIYKTLPYLLAILILVPMSIIAQGKRCRDCNFPIWGGLIPYILIGLTLNLPILFPDTQALVNAFMNSSSGTGGAILGAYWVMKPVNENNLYGAPCKVVFWKCKNKPIKV
ncbi:MAG: DUF805 domain-containing protein [Bdellovibrionales bacterium]